MIHLTTGAPGAGKTLFTFSWVHDLWKSTGRPVCYTKHLKLKGAALEWGWKEVDITKWEDEPDGTIFLVDEAQLVMRKRGPSASVPTWIENLTIHRHRGFDFFLVTQQPEYLDTYVRGLIAAPGWHRHIKRKWGSPLAAVLEWEGFYPDAKDLTSGATANSVSHQAYPKQFYDLYESTSLNTVKKKVPRALWFVLAGFGLTALLFWYAYHRLASIGPGAQTDVAAAAAVADASPAPGASGPPGSGVAPVQTTEQYIASRTPRIADFPHTAPAYDAVTKPVTAPYPAACMRMGDRCSCYSQQGTLLQTSAATCQQIVQRGYFVDWDTQQANRDAAARASPRQVVGQPVAAAGASFGAMPSGGVSGQSFTFTVAADGSR